MKQSKTHRLLSAVLAILMVVTMFPVTAFAAEGDAVYTKITSMDELTTGKYVMVVDTGYAPTVFEGGWILAEAVTAEGDSITNPAANLIWDITVDGTNAKLTDSNGVTVAPKTGNNNGILSGDYNWAVASSGEEFTFSGQGSDTTILASNKGSENKFRAYKTSTVSGNVSGYPTKFTLYKLGESAPEEPIVPEEPITESKNLHGYIQTAEGGKWVSIDPETLEYEVLGTGTATYTGGTAHNGKIYAADATHYYEIDPQNEYAATQGGELLYGFPMSDATSIPASTITIDGQEFEVGGYVPYIVGHSDLGISYLMRLYNYAEGTAEYSFISTYESIAKAVIYTGSELDEENKCYYEKFLVLTEGGIIYETKAKWTVENGALVYSDSSVFKADSFLYVSGGASMVLASEDLAYITTNSANGVKVHKYVISAGTVERIGVIEGATSLAALSLLKDVVPAGSEPEVPPTEPEEPVISAISAAVAGEEGAEFTVKGVVTLIDGSNLYLQDETGGICARFSSAPADVDLGDTVIATGSKTVYRGLPQLGNATYEKSEGLTLSAKETTIGELTTADIATYVEIKNLEVTEIFDNNGGYSTPNITMKDADGNSIQLYKAVVGKTEDGAWEYAVGDVINVKAAVGVYNTTLQLRNTYATEIEKAPVIPSYGLVSNVEEGDTVVMYNAASGTVVSSAASGYKLAGVSVTPEENKIVSEDETIAWVVGKDEAGNWTFTQGEKVLGMVQSGTYVNLSTNAADGNTAWAIEDSATANVHYLKNVNMPASSYGQYYLEYYSGWTAYASSNPSDGQFGIAFYVLGASGEITEPEDPVDPPVDPEVKYAEKMTELPGDGDTIIIYNSGNAMGAAASGSKMSGIAAEVTDNKIAVTEEMAQLLVTVDGDNYIFTLDGKYLTSAATGNGLSLADELTDCGKWTFEAATDGTWYIKNVGANHNGNYNQALEYYSGFTTYGIKETAIYQMELFLVSAAKTAGGKITSAEDFVTGTYAMVVNTGYAMSVLNGNWVDTVQPVIEGDYVTDAKGGIWTLTVEGDSVTITDANGVSIAPKGGNTNGIISGSYKWNWTFDESKGTFTFKGTGSDTVTLASNTNMDPTYGGFNRFRGYKNNTVSGNPSTYPSEFTLYAVVEEVKESVLPNEGDKVVIYNTAAEGVLGAENDNQSISNVVTVVWDYEDGSQAAQPENGAVVFTVSKNGNYYRFYNEAYGYLCSNGTGNNAFYTQEASEDADWTLTEGKEGGWNLESRTAKYNGQYSQYLEYYADSYKTYSMYNVTDYSIYEFHFYPLEESVNTYKDIVHVPAVNIISGAEGAYAGQDWVVEFELDSAFPMVEGTLKVEFCNHHAETGEVEKLSDAEVTGPVNGIYTVTIPAEEIAKVTGFAALKITAEFEGDAEISHMMSADVIDEPSVGAVTPLANAETKEDKRPVISAEIINAGEGATVSMTVNGETVVSVYDGSKVTYTPSADLADGRTTVVVTVVRADGKETSKTWSFTVGEAQYELYFGQLHSHTTYSDGSGSLESALSYIANLPESANVDFVAFTDHSNYFDTSGAANPEAALYDLSLATGESQKMWREYTGAIDEFNASQSKVVALGGFEMTWSGGPGHINTFNTEGIVSRNNTTLNNKTNDAGMKAYYALLSQPEGADSLSQFNHPGSTFGTFTDFAYWDALIDTRIQMVEVGNGEGQIGAGGYYPSYEYYTMALDKGWHLAPTNNQDNHKGKWGNANDARDVVLTDNFSEEGIYQAIRDMRMYSTEDKNLEIGYTVNGLLLGSSITEVPEKLNLEVTVYDPDKSDSISKVEVIVNSGKVAYTWDDPADLADGALSVELDPTYSYYYIRVTEGDGDLAVTAPVWVGESLKLGISSVVCGTSTPVTNEELKLTTTFFNSESVPANIKSITYTANGGEVIGTDTGNNIIPASGTLAIDFNWTPVAAKLTTVTVTAVVDLDGVEYVFTMDIELDVQDADKLVYVGIDASHFNEYVAGNYKDSMGNFGNLAAGYGVRTVELKTSEDLVAACSNPKFKAIILTAPSRRNGNALRDPYATYSDAEISALVAFNEAGGTVVLTGWGDYYESYTSFPAEDHMAAQQNKVLEALGSSIRISDDETKDDSHNGGQAQRLYLSVYDFNSFLLDGVEYDAENPHDNMYTELYSQYGGASIYVVDGEGKPTATVPETVTPAVYGFETTYSADDDKDSFGGLGSTQKYKVGDTEHLMVLASEELEGKGLIVVAGAAFLSNFEVQATIEDSGAEKNYSNYKICENLIKYLNPVSVTPIAEVRAQTETGYKYTIEGIVTSNASGYDKDTAFFDCIYVQDATGGICCFPVAGNYKIGDKVRITGTTEFYQGEPELQVTSIEVIGTGFMDSTPVTPAQVNDRSVEGKLVTVNGILVNYEEANGLIQTIYVKDYSSDDVVRVFIDGYITTAEDVKNIAIGADVTVTGLASYDDTFNAPEGPFPRIRVRNRADVVVGDRAMVEITFVDGEESTTRGYFFGAAMSNIPAPSREGYNFLGWFDEDGVKLDAEYVLYRHTTFTAEWEEIPYVFGDANEDGEVNVMDANLIRRHAAKFVTLEGYAFAAADVDGNGKVNVVDAYLVRQFAAKVIDRFPAEK
ncbi:MAG: CehA/McbA family metallohydrolase [Oscillospiraceae bacterium]|nr:CehA/McbA family metallohydrolase [Oscillospiraceae bacterium]